MPLLGTTKKLISSELFEEWVKEIERNFGDKKRKTVLIIDNCSTHPDVPALDWVEEIFLPPIATLITQPMDQGVIRSLKAKYFSLAVKKQIDALVKGNQLPNFSVLTTMSFLTKAWNSISVRMFMNCFKKSGISEKINGEGFKW